ncbi:RNA-directed DNA polymerase, eukaryota, reverse transcriptase zinc-binding domain protein [Tanacetum coccineum]
MSPNMMEFQDCLNAIEVEDICSSGLHFTWTKNLHKTRTGNMTGILKKLDRVMSNEGFIKNFPQAHAKFLPYIIFDHSLAILCVPTNVTKHIKSFRFPNYITDKQDYPVQDIESSETLFVNKLSSEDANSMIVEAWSIIGIYICLAVREFFSSGKILGELNATFVTLILKIQTPNKVTDFRPIACCNSAFIPNGKCKYRMRRDNILLTQEIIRGYNKKGGAKRVAFKIDIQKSYDACVSTAAFILNMNGKRIGYFKGGRGLRQDDPISPYLFTLIMEVFSLILQREIKKEPKFQYHFGCKSLNLSHVCFADDLLVMCHGDTILVRVIKNALDQFSVSSGLLPNNYKSTMFFGSLNEDECNAISTILPFERGKLPVKYLGVPLIAKRLGIKELLESIHMYWASVFLLPMTKPKDQGGLGLRNLQIWNQALLAKHIWNIAMKKDILWVKLVHSVKLKGKSIWEVFVDQKDSWGWKNLIGIRDQIKNNVLSSELSVGDMIENNEWKWPADWFHKLPTITSLTVPNINDDTNDKMDRLITQDKLQNWGNNAVNRCCLCYNDYEDLKHLFFKCSFSEDVWNRAQLLGEIRASVYHIWQEGNNRIFKDSKRSSEEVFKSIVEMIKLKLIGTTVKDSIAVVPSILEFFWHDCTYLSPIACLDWPGGIETGCVWLDRRCGWIQGSSLSLSKEVRLGLFEGVYSQYSDALSSYLLDPSNEVIVSSLSKVDLPGYFVSMFEAILNYSYILELSHEDRNEIY